MGGTKPYRVAIVRGVYPRVQTYIVEYENTPGFHYNVDEADVLAVDEIPAVMVMETLAKGSR